MVNGRERCYKCDSKSQAKALYGRLKAEQREGKLFEKPKPVPFRELAMEYVTQVDSRRRRKGDDQPRINRWVTAFGSQDVATIVPRQIERVLTELQTEGKQPATLVRYLTVLKAVFNRAVRLGLLKNRSALMVRVPRVNNVLVRYLTAGQETALLDALPGKFRSIMLMAVNTGLRQGELLRLSWADVDWNVGVLTINETKGGERRRVPMNSTVQAILTELGAQHKVDQSGAIFPYNGRYLRRVFERAVRVAGLTPFRFHDLRHTFASRLAMQGANDRTIMALGGWKSPAMLSRYAHLSPTHLWRAVEGLTKIGTGTKTGTSTEGTQEGITKAIEKIGEPPGTRTRGPRLKRAMLYRLS